MRPDGRPCFARFPARKRTRSRVAQACALVAALFPMLALGQSLSTKARESGCVDKPELREGSLYRCTTASGFSAYFNVPEAAPAERAPPKRTTSTPPSTAAGAASAAPVPGLPRVDAATQRGRDDLRRKVLQDELASEEKLLLEARSAFASGAPTALPEEKAQPAKYAERVARLRQAMLQHERNVELLRKELGVPR